MWKVSERGDDSILQTDALHNAHSEPISSLKEIVSGYDNQGRIQAWAWGA